MDLNEKFAEEYKKLKENTKKPNILLAGATGVGKSTLINMVFGKEIAVVGTGRPVTQKIGVFESPDIDVRLFDSKGYEIGTEADTDFYGSVVNLGKRIGKPEDSIHLIWYCIASNGARVTEYDLKAIESFHEASIPTAIILTKADLPSDEEIAALRKVLPDWTNDRVFETSSKKPEYNQISELITWSSSYLSEALQFSFIKSQKADLKLKWEKAHQMIVQHTAVAFGVGFSPLPFSDAPILVANEIGLLVRILHLYDLSSVSDAIKGAGFSGVLGKLLTQGGKSLVSSLLKCFPGVGTLVGGLISGAVGAVVTMAFGEATSKTACTVCRKRLEGKDYSALLAKFGETTLGLAKEYIKQGRKEDDYSFNER